MARSQESFDELRNMLIIRKEWITKQSFQEFELHQSSTDCVRMEKTGNFCQPKQK